MGILYIVSTPIGNLEDISLRALRVLREVVLIAAEDTRTTGRLLAHYDIDTPQTSYHDFSQSGKLESILATLQAGRDVALVSDAGTPGISDPGYKLIRKAIDEDIAVVAVPGASALMAALTVSGLPTDNFVYLGFMPRKATERRDRFAEVVSQPRTLLAFEAPHRLLKCLHDALDMLGDRPVSVGRELTKLHEEVWRGTISGAIARFEAEAPRGEVTLVIGGAVDTTVWTEVQVSEELARQLESGKSRSQAARAVAKLSGWARQEVYRLNVNQ